MAEKARPFVIDGPSDGLPNRSKAVDERLRYKNVAREDYIAANATEIDTCR